MKIYGPVISTYTRIVCMTAESCGVAYEVVPTAAADPAQIERHPFQKVPAIEIDGEALIETVAICQYLDDRYNAGALQGSEPLVRARMNQWTSIANSYIFPATERGLVLPRLVAPLTGAPVDEAAVERLLPVIAYYLDIVAQRLAAEPYFAGHALTLADLFFYPMLKAVQLTPEGGALVRQFASIDRWLAVMDTHPSAAATRWPNET